MWSKNRVLMNFVEDLLKAEIILESENDVFIDASTLSEEELDDWLEQELYPLMAETDVKWLKELEYETYDDIYAALRKDNNWLAVTLMKSALHLVHKTPCEKMYYINNSGGLHMDIPKRMLL